MEKMVDWSRIVSRKDADEAQRSGQLVSTLLLPHELGGREVQENVVFLPRLAWEEKNNLTHGLIEAVRDGMVDVAVIPGYRGVSLVPVSLLITASRPGESPGIVFEIKVW